LEERSEVRLGAADRERILVLGTDGEIVASSQQVDVTTGAGTRAVDLTAFAEGRHAVLDELAAAVSGAGGTVHDLGWAMNPSGPARTSNARAIRRRLRCQQGRRHRDDQSAT
jgi:hypothetical protein